MTVDDSTSGANPVSPTATVIAPPPLTNAPGSSADLRSKDQLLASLKAEVRMLRTRVDALEAERRRFAQPTTTDTTDNDITPAPSAAAVTATPMWRTKNGKQAGWQPSRR